MWEFLWVLGIIPGTNFQITFSEWLLASLLTLIWLFTRKKHITHRNILYLLSIYWQTKKGQQLKLPV